ncbi:MAG: 4Fe-4S ferredoxin, partial [Promethearchaeota archaeon]
PYESKSPQEKWDEMKATLDDCILCYACRQACPMCYCKLCFIDQNKPIWFDKTQDFDHKFVFHLVRALHLAGRCVSCGACHLSCPMGIDLNFITRKLEKIAKQRFGFIAGLDQETNPPLATKGDMGDSEDFMLDEN